MHERFHMNSKIIAETPLNFNTSDPISTANNPAYYNMSSWHNYQIDLYKKVRGTGFISGEMLDETAKRIIYNGDSDLTVEQVIDELREISNIKDEVKSEDKKKHKRSYFRDKNLSGHQKLLLNHILSIYNIKKEFYQSNGYLAELFGVDMSAIRKWVANLEKNGYIKRYNKYYDGTRNVKGRVITPTEKAFK